MTTYEYKPRGVCSRRMTVSIERGIITDVSVEDGCEGNFKGIMKLIRGRNAKEVMDLLAGTSCEGKPTSCPDQLSIAIGEALRLDEAKRQI